MRAVSSSPLRPSRSPPHPPPRPPPSTARSLQDAESRGWGTAIRSVLSGSVPGSAPGDWQASTAAAAGGPAPTTAAAAAGRRLQQQQPAAPATTSLPTQWRRLSRTPSLDAWRLGQPGPVNSLCATQLCAALLAAGVELDPNQPITISPDPTSDITSLRASAQLETWRASEGAAAAAAQQRRIGAIVGAVVGGFVGLFVVLAIVPRVSRLVASLRARSAAARRKEQQQDDFGGKDATFYGDAPPAGLQALWAKEDFSPYPQPDQPPRKVSNEGSDRSVAIPAVRQDRDVQSKGDCEDQRGPPRV
jgi:hypothetical protein